MKDIVVTGAKGRMGRRIIELINESEDLRLIGEIDLNDDLLKVLAKSDLIIDFSTPKASEKNAAMAAESGKPIVIGTTGFTDKQKHSITKASESTAVLLAPNMSIGINVMFDLIERSAKNLSDVYRTEIVETHHAEKKDSPSGTALGMLSKLGASDCDATICEGDEDASGNLIVRSYRRGEVKGDHEIKFSCLGETLTISHHAEDRTIFARGAINAARWIVDKPAGLYDMQDVLGLK